jgi:hypothetical protein
MPTKQAVNWHTFDVRYPDPEHPKRHYNFPPQLVDYPDFASGKLKLVGPDKVITTRREITIKFEYPLKRPTSQTFTSRNGFTYTSFWKAVYEGYVKIYAEEHLDCPVDEAEQAASILINRVATNGRYGIWGHIIEDLRLESFAEEEPGVFSLGMGS